MSLEQWAAVDEYFAELMLPPDPALDAALEASRAAGLPAINVAPVQGRFLQLLAQVQRARRILEIGTLGGYSTIWLARALPPDGRLVTLEQSPKHADVARANIARAGLADRVEIRLGRAVDTLRQLVEEGAELFDLVFVDADKPSTAEYVRLSADLSREGGLIIVDNVVRNGAVVDARSLDENVQGVRRANEVMATHPRLSAAAIQTVGLKGYDGFAMALVTAGRSPG